MTSCCYFNMSPQDYLEHIFTVWEQILTISSPIFVESIQMQLEYKDVLKYENENILMGTVLFVIRTKEKQFSIEWEGVVEPYTDQNLKDKAEVIIAITLRSLLKEQYEDNKYEGFWNSIDFENEDWKKDGE